MAPLRLAAHLASTALLLFCLVSSPILAATDHNNNKNILDDDADILLNDKPDTVPKLDQPLLPLVKQLKSAPFPFLSLRNRKDHSQSSKQRAQEEEATGDVDPVADERSVEAGTVYGAVQSLEKCQNDTNLYLAALALRVPWAVQMYDAYGKMGGGILMSNIKWPGAYEECLDVRATSLDPNVTELQFAGQYCTGTMKTSGEDLPLPTVTAWVGMCVPDSCTNGDARKLYVDVMAEMNTGFKLTGVSCQIVDNELDSNAIAAIAVFGFVGFLMALGTALDIVLIQMPKWRLARMPTVLKGGIESTSVTSTGEAQPLIDSKKPTHAKEPGTCAQLFISFSVYTNGSKLLSTYQPPGSLTCVHGIRFLSMTWVVLGHVFGGVKSKNFNAVPYQMEVSDRFSFMMVANATLSVDSFFVLSGLLVAYLSLKEMEKNRGSLNWPMFYFHRFWRLTPVYMMIIFFSISIQQYMGDGPDWPNKESARKACEENWWTNILYINNLVHAEKKCLGVSWYLANDMQFYMLSPLIFVPFFYSPLYGALSSGAFLLATSIAPGVLTSELNLNAGSAKIDEPPAPGANYNNDYYIKPYCRMGPYIIGLIAGYLLFRWGSYLRMTKLTALLGWAVATGVALACLFGLYDATKYTDNEPLEVWESAMYNALARTAWGACLAWVVVACHSGYGGFVNTMLSWKALVPLSRLTYVIYLIHQQVQLILRGIQRVPLFLNDINIVMYYLSVMIICYLVGAIISLAFEAPMMGLEKILLHGNKRKPAR